jgi:hypothetical protein
LLPINEVDNLRENESTGVHVLQSQ